MPLSPMLGSKICPSLGGQVSDTKGRSLSLKVENVNPLPPNYYKFEIKGLSGKDMGIRNNSYLLGKLK